MIISRTPFRISFFGGSTDFPAYYKDHKTAVIATSIDKYCYLNCRYFPPFFPHKYQINYSKIERINNIEEIIHPSVRETLRFMKINQGVAIQYDSDLPARAGLGTSSSFTVGLVHDLYALKGKMATKRQLAEDAIHIEQNMIGENVGSQDQITAAFGGFNKIVFEKGNFQVHPLTINTDYFQEHLMLFFTGFSRLSSEVQGEHVQKLKKNEEHFQRMYEMVEKAMKILNRNDFTDFGRLLHEHWLIKRKLTNKVTTPMIDKIYEKARNAGALGGKILGAGGGGFMLFFVEPKKQEQVRKALRNLLYVPFKFENLGSMIIHYSKGL